MSSFPAADPVIYLDYNATTPILPEAAAELARASDPLLANPSSLHRAGRKARALLEDCRERLASRLGAPAAGLIFTSGGTESNRLAILGVLEARRRRDRRARGNGDPGIPEMGSAEPGGETIPHAVISSIEHPSTRDLCRGLEAEGKLSVSWVRASSAGRVDPRDLEAACREETLLLSLLHASNETGVIQDVRPVAELCRRRRIAFHCDAVQSLGKFAWTIPDIGADLVSVSSHKVYGPKGCGLLWVREGASFQVPWSGGPQERGRRPGTENLPAIAGFAAAMNRLELPAPALRDRLWRGIRSRCPRAVLNGSEDLLVPTTLNVSFVGVRAETLLIRLDLEGVLASSGSACSSGAREPSHVLEAMGLPRDRIESALRFSTGRWTTADEIDRAIEIIARCVEQPATAC